MPAHLKPDETRQRRNKRQDPGAGRLVAFPGKPARVDAPPSPAGLLKETREFWGSFWGSPLAKYVESGTDGHALRRLFRLYDERERCRRAIRREGMMVKGSLGQRVLNPLARRQSAIDSEVRQMEDRFGLSPRSRLQLGVTFGEAARSLSDLNRALWEDDNET